MSYKKLYGIKCINWLLVVYKGLECIEGVRVPHIDYVYCEAISKSNTLMKFHRN